MTDEQPDLPTGLHEILGAIHTELARELLRRIRSGEITAAEMTNAIKLLQHNNIQGVPQADGGLLDSLADALPFAHQ